MVYTLFIFRRDLRLQDNIGLYTCINQYSNIVPIFIFTPEQITKKNKFRSDNAVQFMIESLKDLDNDLKKYKSKLHIFYGGNISVIDKICRKIDVDNIVFNKDYTPYAVDRDKSIEKYCESKNINCLQTEDYLLSNIGNFNKKDGDPYTVFTPFRNNAMKSKVEKPKYYKIRDLVKVRGLDESGYIKYKENSSILVRGGRDNGLKMLNKISQHKKYNSDRDTVSINTTHLSAYIKFGCVSVREVYWKIRTTLGTKNILLSQIYWREFYYYIAYYFPFVLEGKNYNEKYDNIRWLHSKKNFNAWCRGETGYPIVDAGMRELNKTGYMHNRARLITSNFLNRMLGTDWRKGEEYYATKLTDYDPSVNNGNWQWIASTGVDPKPYFQRLFNPWLQSKKCDPEAEYIKKWIPELTDVPAKHIHQWDKYCHNYDLKKLDYYEPIVNYKEARETSVNMYRKVL